LGIFLLLGGSSFLGGGVSQQGGFTNPRHCRTYYRFAGHLCILSARGSLSLPPSSPHHSPDLPVHYSPVYVSPVHVSPVHISPVYFSPVSWLNNVGEYFLSRTPMSATIRRIAYLRADPKLILSTGEEKT
jgi:hypothetical protein